MTSGQARNGGAGGAVSVPTPRSAIPVSISFEAVSIANGACMSPHGRLCCKAAPAATTWRRFGIAYARTWWQSQLDAPLIRRMPAQVKTASERRRHGKCQMILAARHTTIRLMSRVLLAMGLLTLPGPAEAETHTPRQFRPSATEPEDLAVVGPRGSCPQRPDAGYVDRKRHRQIAIMWE